MKLVTTGEDEKPAPVETLAVQGKWSTKYDACINCHKIDQPHASSGRCTTCYAYYRSHGNDRPVLHEVKKDVRHAGQFCSYNNCPYEQPDYMGMPIVVGKSGQFYCCDECCSACGDTIL